MRPPAAYHRPAAVFKLGYFLTTIALFLIFVVTLVVQLRSSRCNPFFYWNVILSTSMAGTTMSDFMNRDAIAKYLSNARPDWAGARRASAWATPPERPS